MDPITALGAAAAVVGIVSLGIQIAQILQTQIDDVQEADERILQLISEIQGTAGSLARLQDLLQQDDQSLDDKILSVEGRKDLVRIIERCNVVFRNIVALVAKAGKAALAVVDEFQRKAKEKFQAKSDDKVALELELSALDHLMWPMRKSKIERYSADLDRLRLLMVLMLQTATLAKKRARAIVTDPVDDSTTMNSREEENRFVDELYYAEKVYQSAEKTLAAVPERQGIVSGRVLVNNEITSRASPGSRLLQNWPYMPDAENQTPSISDLIDLGVTLEGHVISSGLNYKIPTSMRTLLDQSLQLNRYSAPTVWQIYARLSDSLKQRIDEVLGQIDDDKREPKNILISIEVRKQRRSRLMALIRRFATLRNIDSPGPAIYVIIGRIIEPVLGSSQDPIYSKTPNMRPTYIKVHRTYMDPETLDAYALPWEWDRLDSNYIIIKQWVPEHQQEILFEHTRHLRQERGATNDETSVLGRQNNARRLRREMDRQHKGEYRSREDHDYDELNMPRRSSRTWGAEDDTDRVNPRYPETFSKPRYTSSSMRPEQSTTINGEPCFLREKEDSHDDVPTYRPSSTRYTQLSTGRHATAGRQSSTYLTKISNDSRFADALEDSDDEAPPAEADKAAVADFYLRKWTTVFEKGQDRGREDKQKKPLHAPIEEEEEEEEEAEDDDHSSKKGSIHDVDQALALALPSSTERLRGGTTEATDKQDTKAGGETAESHDAEVGTHPTPADDADDPADRHSPPGSDRGDPGHSGVKAASGREL